MSTNDKICRIRIELDDWDPIIRRRVEVPAGASLKALHDVVQAVMPFDDHHLFEFRSGDVRYAMPMPGGDRLMIETRSAKTTKLASMLDSGIRTLSYTYDFGDDWQFTLVVEAVEDGDPALSYPRFIDGENRGPPEDVGGLPGFEAFLDAMEDPDHEEHDDRMEWYGGPFDASAVPVAEITTRIGKLARRRTIGKAASEKSLKGAG